MNNVHRVPDRNFERLLRVCVYVVSILVFGTCGYIIIEEWSVLDSLFMTVITVSTVGYGVSDSISDTGRCFTSLLIVMCIIGMTYWTATLTSFIVEDNLGGRFLLRKTLKMISKLQEHTIVCGSGRMAHAIVERLVRQRVPVVVLDDNQSQLADLGRRFRNLLTVEGCPTNELSLAEANVLNASHVVAATDSEVDNLLIVITCKDMGRDIDVSAQCEDPSIASRMRKAGADDVVSPFQLSGDRISERILAAKA